MPQIEDSPHERKAHPHPSKAGLQVVGGGKPLRSDPRPTPTAARAEGAATSATPPVESRMRGFGTSRVLSRWQMDLKFRPLVRARTLQCGGGAMPTDSVSVVDVLTLVISLSAIITSIVLWIKGNARLQKSEARSAEQTERALQIAKEAQAATSRLSEETARLAGIHDNLLALKETEQARAEDARKVQVSVTVRSGRSPLDTGIGPNAIFVTVENRSAFPVQLQGVWFRNDKRDYHQWCTPRGFQDQLNIERQKNNEPEQLPGHITAFGSVEVDMSGRRIKGPFGQCLNPVPYESEEFQTVTGIGVRVNGQQFMLEDESSLSVIRSAIAKGRLAKAKHVPPVMAGIPKVGNMLPPDYR